MIRILTNKTGLGYPPSEYTAIELQNTSVETTYFYRAVREITETQFQNEDCTIFGKKNFSIKEKL